MSRENSIFLNIFKIFIGRQSRPPPIHHQQFLLIVMETEKIKLAPESYFPGAASLLEQLDKKVLIVLFDGRHLVGILRSFDHFSVCICITAKWYIRYISINLCLSFQNIVLENTCERIISGGTYL